MSSLQPQSTLDLECAISRSGWTVQDMRNDFSTNMLLATGKDLLLPISLPPGTKVTVERRDKQEKTKMMGEDGVARETGEVLYTHERKIHFKNDALEVIITIMNGVNQRLYDDKLDWQQLKTVLQVKGNWWFQDIPVTFSVKYNPERILTEETAKQRLWVEQMINSFRWDFEWSLIAADLKRHAPGAPWMEKSGQADAPAKK